MNIFECLGGGCFIIIVSVFMTCIFLGIYDFLKNYKIKTKCSKCKNFIKNPDGTNYYMCEKTKKIL